jgi:hypothetical protein
MATVSGPFFSPAADNLVDAGVKELEKRMAAAAHWRLQLAMHGYFRKPTPYYWTRVIDKPRADYHVVTDQGVIYGPWLEGVGSRNRSTRFKGYFHFRQTTQSMNNRRSVAHIVDPVITDIVRVLNG